MIVRALIQPFPDEIDATGLATATESSVIDLGEALSFRGDSILGTDKPLKRMGTKLIVTGTGLTGSTGSVTITVYTGTNGTTATTTVQTFVVTLDAIDHTVELPLAEDLIGRSLKFAVSGTAYTAGTLRVTWE